MRDDAVWGAERPGFDDERVGVGQALAVVARLFPVPRACVTALLVAGAALGVLGDALLRAPEPPGLNLALWIGAVAVAAIALHRRSAQTLDGERLAWLVTGVVFAAGLAWRDAPPLRLLALGSATLTFALAAHRLSASWVRRSGVLRYGGALALGALHAWTAAAIALADATFSTPRSGGNQAARWRRAVAVVRGLAIAVPLLAVFGTLFMSADGVFADLVLNLVRIDFDPIALHLLLFCACAWLSTGYLRGFLTSTELPPLGVFAPKRPTLGITEVATAVAAVDLLFLAFVVVQFRYLFGGDALVQVTRDLTYAEYARRGFFELVAAVVLVVPVLLVADWLLERRGRIDDYVFRALVGVQIALVLAVEASALQRLRLYYASYGLTDSRFYAMVLLIWIGVTLFWLAATVLRGRRHAFAVGPLVSGLATIALLFAVNPDAVIARANVARITSAEAAVRFDAVYATSMSADAVPVLIDALPTLPRDAQCRLARHLLRRWPPESELSIRGWNWSAARAAHAVREHEAQLRSMVGPDPQCAAA